MRNRFLLFSLSGLFAACTLGPPHAAAGGADHSPVHREAVAVAQQLLGTPYRYGGATPKGFDCSGLVHYAYGKAGAPVPRSTSALYRAAAPVNPRQLRPGDLLFFQIAGKISHVGIYAGDRTFIHAPSSGKRVSVGRLDSPYWQDHFIAAGRIGPR